MCPVPRVLGDDALSFESLEFSRESEREFPGNLGLGLEFPPACAGLNWNHSQA